MKFQLYITSPKGTTYLTDFDGEHNHVLNSTFNEKLSLSENDQVTLTFSIAKYATPEDNIVNPFLPYIIFGQTLQLLTPKRLYEVVIKDIAPQVSQKNIIYNVTCQDAFSFRLQRMKLGYSYSTVEKGEIQTIYEIADNVFIECGIGTIWKTNKYNDIGLINSKLLTTKITLEVENSNPYNVIVEAVNSLNAAILINYNNHTVHFYQKDSTLFSGYRYRPEVNLRTLSATYNIDELTTIMHVTGGTDEHDNPVMLVPPMPDAIKKYIDEHSPYTGTYSEIIQDPTFHYTTEDDDFDVYQQEVAEVSAFCTIADRVKSLGQFLYDFSFFRRNGLMTADQENEIIAILEGSDNNSMASINKQLRPLTQNYYDGAWNLNKALVDVSVPMEACYGDLLAVYELCVKETVTTEDIENINNYLTDAKSLTNQYNSILSPMILATYRMLYGRNLTAETGKYVPEIGAIVDKVKYYCNMRDEAYTWYIKKQIEYMAETGREEPYKVLDDDSSGDIDPTDIDPDVIQLKSDIAYYYDRFQLAGQMVGVNKNIGDPYAQDGWWALNIDFLELEDLGGGNWQYKNPIEGITPSSDRHIPSDYTEIESSSDGYFVDCYYATLYKYFQHKILAHTTIESGKPLSVRLSRNIIMPTVVHKEDVHSGRTTYEMSEAQLLQEVSEEIIANPQVNRSLLRVTSINNLGSATCTFTPIVIDNLETHFKATNVSLVYGNHKFKISIDWVCDENDPNFSATFSVDYNIIVNAIADYVVPGVTPQMGIYYQMIKLQSQIENLWDKLYTDYGEFIYETQYENTDETDSVALYNQAVTYFENYRKPKSSYSLTIINPRELEQIGTDNLQINSRIRIYNKDLNLEEGETYESDSNYSDDNAALNNISYTTNEVVVTGLNYDLRKSEEASITVERIISYQNILQKLIKQVHK